MKAVRKRQIWLDGEIVQESKARVPVTTHAIHYGTTAFEGIRAYWNSEDLHVFRLYDHIKRFGKSCGYYSLALGFSEKDLERAVIELCRKSQFRESCYIRPFCFVGEYGINLHVTKAAPTHLAILAFTMGDLFDKNGISAGISSWRKFSNASTPIQAKMGGNYLNSIIATQEAKRNGFDEAILLDAKGDVSEAPGENIFIIKDGRISTPPLSSSALKGITRDSVMEFSRRAGRSLAVRKFGRRELYNADEIFLTGTAAEIVPVTEIDGRTIGDGAAGGITREIMDEYDDIVMKRTPRYARWLTGVYG